MIKDLIEAIAYEKISLSQALTRAKLIAYKINNDQLKDWISNELNGYSVDTNLPDYRILEVETVAIVTDFFGRTFEAPVEVDLKLREKPEEFYKWPLKEGIALLEKVTRESESDFCFIQLPPESTAFLSQFIVFTRDVSLKSLNKRIGVSTIFNICHIVQQNLLDILLDLNKQFPNLENDFNSMEEKKKVSQIITNHIHGNVSNTNFGFGENFRQEQTINQTPVNELLKELKDLGVEEEDIKDLTEIIDGKENNKESFPKKLLKWAGDVTKKSVEKGIELELPDLIEKLQNFF